MTLFHYFDSLKEAKAYIPTFRKHHTYTNKKGMKTSLSPQILKCKESKNKGKYVIIE